MKKNVLIIILTILVLALGAFVGYDKFLKEEPKCITKCETSQEKAEKSADERYKDYLTSLSKSIEKTYVDPNAGEGDVMSSELRNYNTYTDLMDNDYSVLINNKKELLVDYSSKGLTNYKVADNVVSFYRVVIGNGGYYGLYYITTDGKVYSANIETCTSQNDLKITENTGVKNIIEVKSGSSLAGVPLYVDIDGNIFTTNAN